MGRADWLASLRDGCLSGLRKEIETAQTGVLARGRHQVVVRDFDIGDTVQSVAVKFFGRQQGWKDRYDRKRGSKAARSFQAAAHLEAHGVATPPPLAYLERWENGRLMEAYYLSGYLRGLKSLKTGLLQIYAGNGPCSVLVDLLKQVGVAMRRMHDSGFYHRDLGNQNIELLPDPTTGSDRVIFLDLNRGQIRKKLTTKQRALDFSRLQMPSAFLEVLFRIYWASKAPSDFRKQVAQRRRLFYLWQKSRSLRHPIKSFRKASKNRGKLSLRMEDVWIWDDRSAQAAITLNKKDRKNCHSWRNHAKIVFANLKALPVTWKNYRELCLTAFKTPVAMADRIGMSLEPADLDFEPQLALLEELHRVPVLLRVGHHQGQAQWDRSIHCIERLHQSGHSIVVGIFQDRRATLEPESWKHFLEYLFERIDGKVEAVKVGHAMNRVKWGVHNLREYAALMHPLVDLRKKFPALQIWGPACIDFEPFHSVAALDHLPGGVHFGALSHLLYVDRRGAPENKQGRFGTIEKAALMKAIARHSKRCEDRLILSEVNWPLIDTAEWSPVAATYLPPGARGSRVHVSEAQYGHYMIRYLALTICSGLVERVYWWRLVAHGFGLVDERAEGGWRKRVGFQMLQTFLRELGPATFVEKMDTPDAVYALRFERTNDEVVLLWCNGRTFSGPWPIHFQKALDSTGEPIQFDEVGNAPVYLIAPKPEATI